MKKSLSILLMLLVLLTSATCHAEETTQNPESVPKLAESYVTNGHHEVWFSYPEECEVLVEGKVGTCVFLNETDYVAINLEPEHYTLADYISENEDDPDNGIRFVTESEIYVLSDDIAVVSIRDELIVRTYLDYVKVGVALPDGSFVIVMAACPSENSAETGVYDLLLTILNSMTDATPVENWLNDVWLPFVACGAEAEAPQSTDSAPKLAETYATNGSREVTFRYPEGCELVDAGRGEKIVGLNNTDYVAVIVEPERYAIEDYITENEGGSDREITILSDELVVVSIRNEYVGVLKTYYDDVMVGVALPDGSVVVAMATCASENSAETGVYDLLLTILNSMTDATPVENWLNDVWLPSVACRGEAEAPQSKASTPKLAETYVTNGYRKVTFSYPEGYYVLVDGKIGTFVHLNETDYVTIAVLDEGKNPVQDFNETCPDLPVTVLSDTLSVISFQDEYIFRKYYDGVEVGVTLADGSNLIAFAHCLAGNTEVYDLLLTILNSMTDATPVENWLNDVWLPSVACRGEAEVPQSKASTPKLAETYVTNGYREVTFSYPEGYYVLVDGKIGTFVHLNETDYVAIVVLDEGKTPVQRFNETCPSLPVTVLSDTLSVISFQDEYMVRRYYDGVEVGVTLADGSNLIVLAQCLAGNTEVYDLLLTIQNSMTDATPVENWLNDVWLPSAA